MTDTIKNPTANQLEAGGKVSGTYYGLPFTDQELRDDEYGALYIGKHCWINYSAGHGIRESVTVTSYTPPEPKPWWETCEDDEWIEYDIGSAHGRRVSPAWLFRSVNGPENRERTNPRRVSITDADTEVIVPKAAVDQLREAVDTYSHAAGTDEALAAARIAVYIAATTLLAAVDCLMKRADNAD